MDLDYTRKHINRNINYTYKKIRNQIYIDILMSCKNMKIVCCDPLSVPMIIYMIR